MTKRMLIDAAHPEETRIVVANNGLIEELDYETSTKTQIKGNIYLAKIMRVEPSLRAAFVDYGNARHGFLPFSEIHPDYFQIPISDKEKLIADGQSLYESNDKDPHVNEGESNEDMDGSSSNLDSFSNDSELNVKQASIRRSKLYSKYRIQEVIKKRQILLVQITKEERGNKGAALTTFISLAGRYCVLMPNSSNAGGISRKISFSLRKRMKEVLGSLSVPKEMSVILRTAGSERTKTEIRRDLDYLLRLWDQTRSDTMKAIAPLLIHEENHIIKRAIRDNYKTDISEIHIEGDDAYKMGKSFMKLLMPSKANIIKKHKNPAPIFNEYKIEKELELIHKAEVQLKSGGSIVIAPTEALVAIDINSGRSTSERDIEATALKTNLEASAEIARQLKLRDLAGLIVIDYIDMNIRKNNQQVENSLKYAIKSDRAKIQIGRISSFGLLEMSRQRMRPSLLEINYRSCTYCSGEGLVRSIESQTLLVFRSIENLSKDSKESIVKVEVNAFVAEYIFNKKRNALSNIEKNKKITIEIHTNNNLGENEYAININNSLVFTNKKNKDLIVNTDKNNGHDNDNSKNLKSSREDNTSKNKKNHFNKSTKRWKKRNESSSFKNTKKDDSSNISKTKDIPIHKNNKLESANKKTDAININKQSSNDFKKNTKQKTIGSNLIKKDNVVNIKDKEVTKSKELPVKKVPQGVNKEKKITKKSSQINRNKNNSIKEKVISKNLAKKIIPSKKEGNVGADKKSIESKVKKNLIKRAGWWQKKD